MPLQRARISEGWGLALLLAGNFAARWPFRGASLVQDEGEYAHLGQAILRGAVPYADVYNQKPPFVFYWMAAIQAWLGESLEALRITTTLYGSLTILLVFLTARMVFGGGAGLWAALAFSVMSFDQCGVYHSASTEYVMLLWLAAGVFAWYRARDRGGVGWWLLAGACAGMAVQTKQTGVLVLAFFVAERLFGRVGARGGDVGPRAAPRDLTAMVVGFLVVGAAWVGFLATRGALSAYLECVWTNNFQYVGARHAGPTGAFELMTVVVRDVVRWDVGLWVVGAVGLIASGLVRGPGRGLWMLLVVTLGMGLVASRTYVHYWEPMILPLSLGVGAAGASGVARWRSGGRIARGALVAISLAAWQGPLRRSVEVLSDPAGTLAAIERALPSQALGRRAARYVASRTSDEEPILVIGSEPQIYFHAGRPASSRMVIAYPMTGPYTFAERLRGELLEHLRDRGPRYVLLSSFPSSLSEFPEGSLELLREIAPILRDRYDVERVFEPEGARDEEVVARIPLNRLIVLRRRREGS